jgi:hypothetical protein
MDGPQYDAHLKKIIAQMNKQKKKWKRNERLTIKTGWSSRL